MSRLDKLLDELRRADRPVAVLGGAGLSFARGTVDPGVPDALTMVEQIRHEMSERGLGELFERALQSVALAERYAAALEFVRTESGQWHVDELVREAVLRARRPGAPAELEGDGRPEHWHLHRGTVALARLLVEGVRPFVGPVLTTNFDPLLSLAIEAAGGRVDRRIVRLDGSLPETERTYDAGVRVVHLQGYWRGDGWVHQPRYLTGPSPELEATLRQLVHGHLLLVVAHRGSPSRLLHALRQLAQDWTVELALWWCFEAEEADVRVYDGLLLDQLRNATLWFGVDAHELFERLALPEEKTDERTGVELVRIPGGTFLMGSPEGEGHDDERPQHEVELAGFYLAKTPVTNAQYAKYLEANPSAEKPEYWDNQRHNQPQQPVVGVSWEDAQAYCKWAGMVLPTEAQWEYACRAGTTTRYWSGDDEADLAKVAWYSGNSERHLHPVGEKPANPFGLLDMHGNVREWCLDGWAPRYTKAPREGDGLRQEPVGDADRVIRGGSWYYTANLARSACRFYWPPDYRSDFVGFRPAQVIPAPFTSSPRTSG